MRLNIIVLIEGAGLGQEIQRKKELSDSDLGKSGGVGGKGKEGRSLKD